MQITKPNAKASKYLGFFCVKLILFGNWKSNIDNYLNDLWLIIYLFNATCYDSKYLLQ